MDTPATRIALKRTLPAASALALAVLLLAPVHAQEPDYGSGTTR